MAGAVALALAKSCQCASREQPESVLLTLPCCLRPLRLSCNNVLYIRGAEDEGEAS